MGKKTSNGRAPTAKPRGLNWHQERFVEAYVDNGGNASAAYRKAYPTCSPIGARSSAVNLLAKSNIQAAIEAKQQEYRDKINFRREDYLRILVGMVEASLDDFTKVFDDPTKKKNYRGLGHKRMALEGAKKTTVTQEDGSTKETSEIKIISAGERRCALNELWDKLGFGKVGSDKDRAALLGELFGAVAKLTEKKE